VLVLVMALISCAAPPRDASGPVTGSEAEPRQRPLFFSFTTTEGKSLDHSTTRGRATALLFLTTFDPASQVQAKALEQAFRSHRPRVNAGAVVLEAQSYGVLADVFRESLKLTYPVALADAATLSGDGPFGKIDRVPTTVVLDRAGRVVWQKAGLATIEELSDALSTGSSGR
jgi:hypothetical protein